MDINSKIDCILISFDYKKENSPDMSYAVASLILFSKRRNINIKNYSLNMNNISSFDDVKKELLNNSILEDITSINSIAISCYVWSKKYIKTIVEYFKEKGFKGKFILGGYEITYNTQEVLVKEYPDIDIFIFGDAEESLFNAIKLQKKSDAIFFNKKTLSNSLPLVYSSGVIYLNSNMKVNIETKRGCPYSCTFCAHRDLSDNKVFERDIEDIKKELIYLNSKNVKKVNFLDPIFNIGKTYIEIIRFMHEIKFTPTVSFQTRFELIKGEEGIEFLKFASKSNVILEFGLQTIIPDEFNIIKRKNKKEIISNVLKKLNELEINYEVSLIYGLPRQTLKSFKESIKFLEEYDCKKIIAFPLMLLAGTKLYFEKEKYNLKEKEINHIKYVISSDSFNEFEYFEMEEIANKYLYYKEK